MDFRQATNTVILSDIHLSEAEPAHPTNPYWKKFKRREYFVDDTFRAFVQHLMKTISGPIELILNGDIFDFDSVMRKAPSGAFHISWLEKMRGLSSEEAKSRFKLKVIMDDHVVWMQTIREFILQGNRLIFIVGNHDIEFHWMSTREDFVAALDLPETHHSQVRFCEWFYLSNGDTLVEHGNQYDAYSVCANPIHPLIQKGARVLVRVPFGNLAGKYILNGMGLFNPHSESSFIKESLAEYVKFYYQYVLRTQPFLMWSWFWGALTTLVFSVSEGLLPPLNDPLTAQRRVEEIAERSNATPTLVWTLKELHVHAAVLNPLKVLRELWLDRAILFGLMVLVSFQFFSFLNVFTSVSYLWFLIPMALLMPLFIFYARSVESEVQKMQREAIARTPIAARLAGVQRVVQGHTHVERHFVIDGIEYLNTGTWSNAYKDVECTELHGRKCYTWIRSTDGEGPRISELYAWTPEGPILIPQEHGRKRNRADIRRLRKRIRRAIDRDALFGPAQSSPAKSLLKRA